MVPRNIPWNIPYFETKPALDHPLWWKNDDPTFAHGFKWMDIAFLVGFQSMGHALLPRAFPKSFWDQIQTIQMGGDSQMKTIRSPFASQVWVWFRFLGEKTRKKHQTGPEKVHKWVGFTKKHLQNIRLENHLEMGHHWTSTGTKHLQKTHGPMAFIPSKELPLSPAHQQRSPGNSTGGCKRARHGQVTEPKLSKITIWFSKTHQNSPKLDLLSLLMSTSCDWTSQISTRNQPGVPPRPALPKPPSPEQFFPVRTGVPLLQ